MSHTGSSASYPQPVAWFLNSHDATNTEFEHETVETNLGRAFVMSWCIEVWAWVWLELEPVQVATGWPGGSIVLDRPYVSRSFANQMARFRMGPTGEAS